MRRLYLGVAITTVSVGGLATVGHAHAQGSTLAAPKNVAVRERPHPEYDAPGIPMGAFRLNPGITVSGIYDDNIFATRTNEAEDLIAQIEGRATLSSQWSSNALNFFAGVRQDLHADYSDENTTSYDVGADGRIDVDRFSSVVGSLTYADAVEPRSMSPSVVELAEPIRFTTSSASVSAITSFNRLTVTGRAGVSAYDYEDGRQAVGGAVVEQDDRDRTVVQGSVRAEYGTSPDTGIFVDLRANSREYDLAPPQVLVSRDSAGYEALVGSRFDISNLVRGEIGVGYQTQSYDDPSAEDTKGASLRANVDWFPDQLVTVSFRAAREIQDAGAIGAISYVSDGIGAKVDYEYRRNIILSASGSYSNDQYEDVDRQDKRWQVGVSGDYLMNQNVALFAAVDYLAQTSDGVSFGREYQIARATIGLKLRR